MKLKSSLVCFFLFCMAFNASAACVRADLTGTWKVYTVLFFGSVMRCTLIMPASGVDLSSKSSCFVPDINKNILSPGNLTISSSCRVTGQFTVGDRPTMNIDAYINIGKDSMSGLAWKPFDDRGEYIGNIISGVKL